MKVFLINLDKNPERLAAADAQLRKVGVDYERFPAVYGKALSEEEKARVYDDKWARRISGSSLNAGEIGCALSHIHIYERMVNDGIPYALILEDDVYPTPALPHVLAAIEQEVSLDESVVVLLGEGGGRGILGNRRKLKFSVYAIDEILGGLRTHAYVITLTAAKRLVPFLLPIVMPADGWGRMVHYGQIRLYTVNPLVVAVDCSEGMGSTIAEAFWKAPPQRTFVQKWRRRSWRLWWRIVDNFYAWRNRTLVRDK